MLGFLIAPAGFLETLEDPPSRTEPVSALHEDRDAFKSPTVSTVQMIDSAPSPTQSSQTVPEPLLVELVQ